MQCFCEGMWLENLQQIRKKKVTSSISDQINLRCFVLFKFKPDFIMWNDTFCLHQSWYVQYMSHLVIYMLSNNVLFYLSFNLL